MADKYFVYLSRTANFFRLAQTLAWDLEDRHHIVTTIEANRNPRLHQITTVPFLVVERSGMIIFFGRVAAPDDIDSDVLLSANGALSAASLDAYEISIRAQQAKAQQLAEEQSTKRAAEVAELKRLIVVIKNDSKLTEDTKKAMVWALRGLSKSPNPEEEYLPAKT